MNSTCMNPVELVTRKYPQRIIKYACDTKKILSQEVNYVTRQFVKGSQEEKATKNLLNETIYKGFYYDGEPSIRTQTRRVYSDNKYGTKAEFESYFHNNPDAPSRKLEVTDRTHLMKTNVRYGYNVTLKTADGFEINDDSSIAKEIHGYQGCINAPKSKGERIDIYTPDEHLHYVNGQLYSTNEPVKYYREPRYQVY